MTDLILSTSIESLLTVTQKHTFEIDVRNIDTLRITTYPGFLISNPLDDANSTIKDVNVPVALPMQVVYQYHNRSYNDRLERETVAVLEAPGSQLDVPASRTIGSDWSYNGPGLTIDMHNAVQRALTGNERAGNYDDLSKPLEEETGCDAEDEL
jgi:hypothetical protein